jgi:acyl-CoA reductase-like NAD-dependent aldehyde dehydrogenase
VRKQKTQKELNAIVDALYRERDSDKWLRLINSLTPNERDEVLKRATERIETDKAQFSKLFEKAVGKKLRE